MMRVLVAVCAAVFLVAVPSVAAEGPDDPPEGCTTKVPFTPIAVTLGGREITVVGELWICPPPPPI